MGRSHILPDSTKALDFISLFNCAGLSLSSETSTGRTLIVKYGHFCKDFMLFNFGEVVDLKKSSLSLGIIGNNSSRTGNCPRSKYTVMALSESDFMVHNLTK